MINKEKNDRPQKLDFAQSTNMFNPTHNGGPKQIKLINIKDKLGFKQLSMM